MAAQTTRTAHDSSGIFHISSVVFSVIMDSSVNIAGMDIRKNVTKALEHTELIDPTHFRGIRFNHTDEEHTLHFSLGTNDLSDFKNSINDSLISSNNNWVDLLNVSYVNQDINSVTITNWNGSISHFCQCSMNAAYDLQSDNIANNITHETIAPYHELVQENFDNFHYLNVEKAFHDSSHNIHHNEFSFGSLLVDHIVDTLGDINLLTDSGFIADILRQATSEEDTIINSDTDLGHILADKKLEFILQIKGAGDSGEIKVINNAFNLNLNHGRVGGFTGDNCTTLTSGNNTNEIHVAPLNLLLRYNFDSYN